MDRDLRAVPLSSGWGSVGRYAAIVGVLTDPEVGGFAPKDMVVMEDIVKRPLGGMLDDKSSSVALRARLSIDKVVTLRIAPVLPQRKAHPGGPVCRRIPPIGRRKPVMTRFLVQASLGLARAAIF